ncbi:MAG TPA: hypothetical protein VI756_29740 [Blastocatellia bacterium]
MNDILQNKVLGREYKKGLEDGRQNGEREGKREGKLEGELTIRRRQLGIRFGTLPEWAEARLANGSPSDIELFGYRVLGPDLSLEEVLKVSRT